MSSSKRLPWKLNCGFAGFRQNTDPRSTDSRLTALLTPLLPPYEINGKMEIKKAQNY